MKKAQKIEVLKKLNLFSELSKRQLAQVAKVAYEYPVPYKPGKVFVRQGDPGQELFIILEGKAVVKKGNRVIAELKKGDFFGELSLLDGKKRSASVEAKTEVRVMGLSAKSFRKLLDDVPGLSKNILFAVCRYLRNVDKLQSKLPKK